MTNQVSKSTLHYYDKNAVEFADQTVSIDMHNLYELFINQLPQRDMQCILDVGCGSGRDADYLAEQGYDVTAIDASAELIEWACASLLHVPFLELPCIIESLLETLADDGNVLVL